jgi:hypothetical protein
MVFRTYRHRRSLLFSSIRNPEAGFFDEELGTACISRETPTSRRFPLVPCAMLVLQSERNASPDTTDRGYISLSYFFT